MPKLVYVCNYCGNLEISPFLSNNIDKVIKHEKECIYNPENKRCACCKTCSSVYCCRIRSGEKADTANSASSQY